MELSAAGLELIKTSEGFRANIYADVAGIPTIGYGHRVLPHETFPNGLTEAEAVRILATDVFEAQRAVLRLVKVPLTQGQFDALTDFCFNLGAGRLASSTLLKALNASPIRSGPRTTAPLGSRRRGSQRSPAHPPRSRSPPLESGRKQQADGV